MVSMNRARTTTTAVGVRAPYLFIHTHIYGHESTYI